ncbi:MAG: hypothetical protein VKN13_06780 [Cyanobacteriota bacterium]|nr:hypothetical protein [Cyanobacteriota bacterium]
MTKAAPLAEPSAESLLAIERQVRQNGTALTAKELEGCWWLQEVWPKATGQPTRGPGWLFRGLAARLEIGANTDHLPISNAVALGGLELRFRGRGTLRGRRPLLAFQFDHLELSLAGRVLWRQVLPPPNPKRQPFFALIHRDPNGWLAARGRAGGLALWRLATAGPSQPDSAPGH